MNGSLNSCFCRIQGFSKFSRSDISFDYSRLQVLDTRGRLLTALGYGLWPSMVLLSEIVQTFILADFCYYYVKRYIWSSISYRLRKSIVTLTNDILLVAHAVFLVANWCCGFRPGWCEHCSAIEEAYRPFLLC
jgi:hypothetical protein